MPEDELTALLTLNRIDGIGSIGAKYLFDILIDDFATCLFVGDAFEHCICHIFDICQK